MTLSQDPAVGVATAAEKRRKGHLDSEGTIFSDVTRKGGCGCIYGVIVDMDDARGRPVEEVG